TCIRASTACAVSRSSAAGRLLLVAGRESGRGRNAQGCTDWVAQSMPLDHIRSVTPQIFEPVGPPTGRARNAGRYGRILRLQQLPQHILQDAAVAVVLDLLWRVDANDCLEAELPAAVGIASDDLHHARPLGLREGALEALDVEHLAAGDPQLRIRLARLELQRQYAHADEVR